MTTPHDVLDFWFGTLDERGLADQTHTGQWWTKDPGLDHKIRSRFGAAHEAALRAQLTSWAGTPRGRLALVILLDQFSRNLGRDSSHMYDGDPAALRLALEGIELGVDQKLAPIEATFLYMPLMHCELAPLQDAGVRLFTALADSGEMGPSTLRPAAAWPIHEDGA